MLEQRDRRNHRPDSIVRDDRSSSRVLRVPRTHTFGFTARCPGTVSSLSFIIQESQLTFSSSVFDKYVVHGQTSDYAPLATSHSQPETRSSHSLDQSQRDAFSAMTTQELSIVQGPPGTGKTFTTMAAIERLIRTHRRDIQGPAAPLILTAQTNHAVDQLLQRYIENDDGIRIVRLGGQSRNQLVQKHSLHQLRRSSKFKSTSSQRAGRQRRECFKTIKNLLKACFPEGLVSAETFRSHEMLSEAQVASLHDNEWESSVEGTGTGVMAQWLDTSYEPEHRPIAEPRRHASAVPTLFDPDQDEDMYTTLDGPDGDEDAGFKEPDFVEIPLSSTGKIPSERNASWKRYAEKLLLENPNLYRIKPAHRGMVYRYLRQALTRKTTARFREVLIEYAHICTALKTSRAVDDASMIAKEGIDLIGCTTTGLAKYRSLFKAIRPDVLIVEEAAQILEAALTSCLLPSLQHLVLVGDHQQLRPSVVVQELMSKHHNLDVSLFERLVLLGNAYHTLMTQRRMIPTLRSIMQLFYHCQINDHVDVLDDAQRPPVPGMGGRHLSWYHHTWPETRHHGQSYCNLLEARMTAGFTKYLILRGTGPKQITILSYYKGQVEVIERELKSILPPHITEDCRVRTVDGFQGEENDVVILSLVRSTNVGFLKDEHRAVVATSRARRAFYVLGNATNLSTAATWRRIIDLFRNKGVLGDVLPVTCEAHHKTSDVANPADWQEVLTSGCCPSHSPDPLKCAKPSFPSRPPRKTTGNPARNFAQNIKAQAPASCMINEICSQPRARYRSSEDFIEDFTVGVFQASELLISIEEHGTAGVLETSEPLLVTASLPTHANTEQIQASHDRTGAQTLYHDTWQQTTLDENGTRIESQSPGVLVDYSS